MSLKNPYKKGTPGDGELKRLTTTVDLLDWQEVHGRCPMQGFQDALLATLFQKFATAVKDQQIPFPTSPSDYGTIEDQLTALVQGCAFPPIN